MEADGRHLWRVIDNLLSNCAKYALEGTRIYLEVRRAGASAVLSIKNISRDPLNVPPETLMERFVRGDESRTTEGSGLGLSIAQSLTELQRGRFALEIDGDLFKAAITLPLADRPPVGGRDLNGRNLRSRGDVSAPRHVKKSGVKTGTRPRRNCAGGFFAACSPETASCPKRLDGWGQAGYTDFDERRRNREGRAAYRPVLAADPGGSLCPGQHARGSGAGTAPEHGGRRLHLHRLSGGSGPPPSAWGTSSGFLPTARGCPARPPGACTPCASGCTSWRKNWRMPASSGCPTRKLSI